MCQRRDDVRSRHIDVRHHFVLTLLEEKLAIFGHKTSKNQLSYVFKKLVDLNSFLYLWEAIGIHRLLTINCNQDDFPL